MIMGSIYIHIHIYIYICTVRLLGKLYLELVITLIRVLIILLAKSPDPPSSRIYSVRFGFMVSGEVLRVYGVQSFCTRHDACDAR